MTTDDPNLPALDAEESDALRAIGWMQSAGGTCPDSSLLLAADEGVLDEAVASRVRAHVATCATCQLLLEDLATVLAEAPDEGATSRIRAKVAAGASTRRARPYIWLGAGGLALAAGLVWFIVVPKSSPPPAPDSVVARATPTQIPSVFVVDRPSIPAGDVEITVRGDTSTRVRLESQIAAALDKADKGDVAGATTDLQTVFRRHQTSRLVALALGAVELRAGRNAEAVATLDRARSLKGDVDAGDEAGWFLGLALVRTGDTARARAVLDEVCQHGGARGASACAGVAEIDRGQSGK